MTAWSHRSATPHESTLAEAFHAVLGEEPPLFATLFDLGERGDMESLLREAGVKDHALIERVQRMAIFPSPESYWQGMVFGRPLAPLARSLTEQQLTAIKADTLNRMEPYKAKKGYISPMEAVIVTITKP